jgi:hypothetical protein
MITELKKRPGPSKGCGAIEKRKRYYMRVRKITHVA